MITKEDVDAALYAGLSTDSGVLAVATGGVWNSQAADGATLPYLVFLYVTETRFATLRSLDVVVFRYLVKGITDSTNSDIATAIDTAAAERLHKGTLALSGFVNCRRVSGIVAPDPDGGWNIGAYYEITTKG